LLKTYFSTNSLHRRLLFISGMTPRTHASSVSSDHTRCGFSSSSLLFHFFWILWRDWAGLRQLPATFERTRHRLSYRINIFLGIKKTKLEHVYRQHWWSQFSASSSGDTRWDWVDSLSDNSWWHERPPLYSVYNVFYNKGGTILMVLSLSNLNQFSKFFHWLIR